jgi:hypothetical protein
MNKKITKLFLFFNFLITIIYLTLVTTPYLYKNQSNSFTIILLVIWFFSYSLIILIKGYNPLKRSVFRLLLFWLAWIILLKLFGYSTSQLGYYKETVLFFFPIFILDLYLKVINNKKYLKSLFVVLFILLLVNIFDNIFLLLDNEIYSLQSNSVFRNTNAGGTVFSSTALFAGLVSVIILLKSKKINNKIINFIFLMTCLFYIYLSGRTTAVLLVVIGIIAMISQKTIRLLKRNSLLIFILLFLFVIFLYLYLPSILIYFGENINNNRIASRLTATGQMLMNGVIDIDSEFFTRILLAIKSLETFTLNIINFLFGAGYHMVDTTDGININYMIIGQHSEIFDFLASYGIFGLFIMFKLFKSFFFDFLFVFKFHNLINQIKVVLIVFIFYSILNRSFNPQLGLILFLFLPTVLYVNFDNNYKNNFKIEKKIN